ncbi:MAG: hypothetical protein LBL92_06015 [Propionibacteriaceae bacterium]|jgi:predicted transposase/invertase (TIGR01784 family)|nr:hypothetical protein [Propionibacteriaceae bacterium]
MTVFSHLHPTQDLLFKKMLASPGHLSVTQGFIRDFFDLEVPLENIHLTHGYSIGHYTKILRDHLDDLHEVRRLFHVERDITIQVQVADLTIELQIQPHMAFLKRLLYYGFRRYTENYRPDIGYRSLLPVRSLALLGFPLYPQQELGCHHFVLTSDSADDVAAIPEFQLTVVEYRKSLFATEEQAAWCHFLNGQGIPQHAPDYLAEAATIINDANLTGEEKDLMNITMDEFIGIEMAEREAAVEEGHAEGLAQGLAEGLAKGLTEGHAEERAEIIRHAIAAGLSDQEISRITGLAQAEIAAQRSA